MLDIADGTADALLGDVMAVDVLGGPAFQTRSSHESRGVDRRELSRKIILTSVAGTKE